MFTYTATQALAPGTADQQLVTRNFRLVARPQSRKAIVKQNISLSGAVESLLHRREHHVRCLTALLDPNSLVELQVIEFLMSVQNGEIFTFDRLGTPAVPNDPQTHIMVSTNFTAAEVGKKYHQYGFVIRAS